MGEEVRENREERQERECRCFYLQINVVCCCLFFLTFWLLSVCEVSPCLFPFLLESRAVVYCRHPESIVYQTYGLVFSGSVARA